MSRRGWLWVLGGATLVIGAVLQGLDRPMWDAGGPGIVGFEFAWDEEGAERILGEWDGEAEDAARLSLWIDFLYLVAYGAFFALATAALGAPRAVVLLAPLAAVADAVEDVALLVVLDGSTSLAGLASIAAIVKFALIGTSIGFVVVALARRRPRIAAAGAAVAILVLSTVVVATNQRTRGGTEPLALTADGDREDPNVVLIHGFTADQSWWDPVVPALVERGLYVIRVDLRGHGRSPAPRDGYAIDRQADAVAEAVKRHGIERAAIVGHSMGGAVAIALAERRPDIVKRVMVIGTGPRRDTYKDGPLMLKPAFLPVTGHLLKALAPDPWVRHALEHNQLPEVDLSERQATAPTRTTWRSFRGSVDAVVDYVEERPLDERVVRLGGKPFTALFGDDDRHAKHARRYERAPNAKVTVLDGLGHSPQIERPSVVARLIGDFGRRRPLLD